MQKKELSPCPFVDDIATSRIELISYIESILLGDPFGFLINFPESKYGKTLKLLKSGQSLLEIFPPPLIILELLQLHHQQESKYEAYAAKVKRQYKMNPLRTMSFKCNFPSPYFQSSPIYVFILFLFFTVGSTYNTYK